MAQKNPPSASSPVPPSNSLTRTPAQTPISPSVSANPKSSKNSSSLPPPKIKSANKKSINLASIPFWLGLLISIMWVGVVVLVVAESGPAHTFGGLPLVNWAIGISAIASPVALIWMVTAYLQRAADIQTVAEPLRRQLSIITGESGLAEARIRRFNQAIREQVDLLKDIQSSSHGDFAAIIDRVQKSRLELEQFEQSSIEQVRDIQDIIRRNMQQVEQLMDDKFTMMRVLDDKLVQSGDGVARQTEAVRDQIAKLLEDVDVNNRQLMGALERAQQDGKRLNETSRLQESTLVAAAENAAEVLGNVSNKIDLSVARFLERAGMARHEAEHLAEALDSQTRALDEFTSTLPARVTETEVILRGVADRLYSSEQLAREQAAYLTEKLTQQLDGLQGFMDRFTTRFTELDGAVGKKCIDLDQLAERIIGTAGDFTAAWEKSVNDLSDRSNNALLRFTVVNDETRTNADAITSHLTETTARYEEAAKKMRGLVQNGHGDLKGVTEQIESQLKQFDSLHETSRKMGEEVESRASAAMQNLQYVLERLLAAREATQTVGETLVKDLFKAVDQNESLIGRLNEAVKVGVATLSSAAESLGKQEGDLSERARAAEKVLQEAVNELQQKAQSTVTGLREQTSGLTSLLAQAQAELDKSDGKFQSFVTNALPPVQEVIRQVGVATDQGIQSLSLYGDGVQEQLHRLQGFHANIGGMGEDIARVTVETVASIEQIQTRFSAARSAQEETAQQTLMHFADLADRLQREVVGLDGQAAQAVSSLQTAAARVGEQSYQMLQSAENSSGKIQLIATALQNEATQIRTVLQQQADNLGTDLETAEKQFASLGEAIQQRTDAAYALLDRVAVHYNETTNVAANNLDARTDRLQVVTGIIQTKVETLSGALGEQLTLLSQGSEQLEVQATQIAGAGGKALQQLSAVNEKLALAHESANRNSQQTITKLEETSTVFMRQSNALAEAAQNSTTLIHKAGVTFGEQSSQMLDQTHQAEQQLRQLSTITQTMSEQSSQIRASLEQQSQRLVTQLIEAVKQLEVSSEKIQHSSATAIASADQVSVRFDAVSEKASAHLSTGSLYLEEVASKAESTLGSIGVSITQQAASLSVLGDQLVEQQRALSSANEGQRQQLVDLFDKLGQAHGQASQVAERTIAKLEDSLHQISRQLGAMSDQSQTAVSNVRTAGDGFAEQSGILLQNAQQAEQQARTVLSVTAALQDQARHLREALHGEGDRAGELLGGLIGKLTSGGEELRDFSTSTETVLTSLANNIAQQSQSLNITMQQIGDRQNTLTTALDAQRDVMNGLLNRLTVAQDETASVAERTVVRLSDGADQMTRQLETLESQAKAAVASIQAANNNFAENAEAVGAHARATESHVHTMISATATLQDQSRQMRESMQSEGERTNAVLSNLLGRLTQSGDELRALSHSTESTMTELQGGFTHQAGEMGATMQQILERQKILTAALAEQRDVMNALLNRLTSAQDETATLAERTVERLALSTQHVSTQIESLETQANAVISSVRSANSGFVDEADVLGARAQEVEQQVRSVQSTTAAMAEQTRQIRDMMQTDADQQARSIQATTAAMMEQARQLRESLQSEGERTTEALSNLLSRLTQSGEQVRSVTSETKSSFTELQTGFSHQATEMGSTMQEILDRQRALTTALSEQREVMNDMLSRLTSAQAETATVAEKTVERLNSSAQNVAQKIDTLETQAKTVVASVHAANSSFIEEADILNSRARDAEQQVRSIQTTTAAIAEQTRLMRETLQGEGERASDVLMGLMNRLAQSGNQLRDLASTTETSIVSLQGGFSQQAGEMGSTMQQILERQKVLTSALSEQREVMNALLARLTTAQDETATVAERSVMRLSETTSQMSVQIEGFDKQVRAVIDNVEAANNNFAQEANVLNAHAREAEQQARSVMLTTTTLQEQARQIRETLQSESERAGASLTNLLDRLSNGGEQLRLVASSTEASITELQGGFSLQAGEMGSTMQQILERQKILTSALSEQREVLNGLLVRLTMAQDETATSAERSVERISDSASQMTQQFEAFDSEAKKVVASVHAANSSFADEADLLNSHAREAEQHVRSIKTTTEEMAEKTRLMRDTLQNDAEQQVRSIQTTTAAIAEQTRLMRETLQGEGERASDVLMGLMNRLAQSGNQLRDLASTTETSIVSLQGGFSQQAGEMGSTMQQILERQKVLTSALSEQREVMNALLARLTTAQDETATVAERSAGVLTESAQKVVNYLVAIESQAKATLSDIEAAGKGFAEESGAFNNYAEKADQQARAVQNSTAFMAQQTRQLRESLENEGERAGNILSGLITQLGQGGSKVQEVTTNSEIVLSKLNLGLSQQTEDINVAMLQIVERQKLLTSALSEQREMMGSLLTHVAQAQDQTAASTERTVIRLSEGAQEIVKHLESIGNVAQGTLAEVHAAGRGFGVEANNLSVEAKRAEENMKEALGVVAGLQQQAQSFRQSMQSETERVLAEMKSVVAQLDVTHQQLTQQSRLAVDSMDQSTLQLATIAKQSAEAVQKQAAVLHETTSQSETKLAAAGEKIVAHIKLVSDVGTQTEVQARQLAEAADFAQNRLDALRGTILDSDRDGQGSFHQAASRIESVKTTLEFEIERLSNLAKNAVGEVVTASQKLSSQSDVLRANLSSSESALNEAAMLVREESAQLPAKIDRSTFQIEAAVKSLKERTAEIDGALVGTTDRFIEVTTTARESILDEMRRIGVVAEDAGGILRQFTTALANEVTTMQTSTETLSKERLELVESSNQSVIQLSATSDRLMRLCADTTSTAEKLAREFETIDQRANSTTQHLEKASETTTKTVEAMTQAAQRAEAQVLTVSSNFRDQLERIRGGLQGQIDDINTGLTQITTQLERTGTTLRSTTAGAVGDVERVSLRFNETSQEASAQMTDKTTRMRGATEEVAKLLSSFGDQIDILLDRLSMAGDGIKRNEGTLVNQMQTALTHLSSVAERLETGRNLAANVSEQAVSRLTEVVEAIQTQMSELSNGSQTAAGIMRGIGQIYGEQTATLNNNVGEAHVQVQAMNKAIDDMQQRTDRIRVALKLQSDELMEALQQILTQLAATGDVLEDKVDQALQSRVQESLKKIS